MNMKLKDWLARMVLYVSVLMGIGLLIWERTLPLSLLGHQFAEIGIVMLVLIFINWWISRSLCWL